MLIKAYVCRKFIDGGNAFSLNQLSRKSILSNITFLKRAGKKKGKQRGRKENDLNIVTTQDLKLGSYLKGNDNFSVSSILIYYLFQALTKVKGRKWGFHGV